MSIVKRLRDNSGSGKEFESVTTSEVTYDTTPQVGSFNPVVSDGIAKALEVATEIPVVSAETNGKVLTASWNSETGTGSTSWAEAQGGDVVIVTYDTTKVAEISATIKDAIAAGKPVVMYNPTDKVVAPMTSCTVQGDTVDALFCITKGTAITDKTYISYQLVGVAGVLLKNTGTIVPAVSLNADAGKVLTAGSTPGAVSWQRVYPEATSADAGKVLAVNSGATGTEWVDGVTSYADITTGTAVLDRDNAVVTSTADITSVTVGADVKQAVVQWTVSSTTTLPTVVDANSNPLKAASNNPSALTVGKTYQLSILNDCYVIAEFA